MKATDLLWTCENCDKEFRVFADDGGGDFVVCWNWCPRARAPENCWTPIYTWFLKWFRDEKK